MTLNPSTSLSVLEEVLELVNVILVMTVNPGAGGQTLIDSQLDKIRRLKRMLDERGLETLIAVDGGIDATTAPLSWMQWQRCWYLVRASTPAVDRWLKT